MLLVSELLVLVMQQFGVGHMIKRSLVRLPAKSTRSTQPSIPPG